jgi:hypothetical protein
MAEVAREKPMLNHRLKIDPLSRIDRTLAEHYEHKQALYSVDPPTIYDRDLRRVFADGAEHRRSRSAATFLRRNRAKIRQMVARWTREYQPALDAVLDDMIARTRELKLKAIGSERELLTDFTLLLMARTVDSLYSPSRRQWIAL